MELSWLFSAILAWCLVHHYDTGFNEGIIWGDDADETFESLGSSHQEPGYSDESVSPSFQRRTEEAAGEESSGPQPPFSVGPHNEIFLTIPCYTMLKPCGNVSVPSAGLDITGPLGIGSFHVPGPTAVKEEVVKDGQAFSHYTVWVVVLLVLVWACMTCCIPSRRKKMTKHITNTLSPPDEDDDSDDDATPEEKEKEKKAALDPESEDFIAPGNIYRLLAVLHPGVIGHAAWVKYASKALICAYMQLFLPYSIIKGTLKQWEFVGIKSPVWFAMNAGVFATMFAALGSLCNLFQGKCAESIEVGLGANFYILTHKGPDGAPTPEKGSPLWGPTLIKINEVFWCTFSMVMNISMSLMLELAMFLKIATYTGAIDKVAVVAVSLYFIFDLDDKVMESDPKLKPKYRRAVAKQTQERDEKPKWLKTLAYFMIGVSQLMTPIGLFSIILFAWRNASTGHVIGGSGLE